MKIPISGDGSGQARWPFLPGQFSSKCVHFKFSCADEAGTATSARTSPS
jgi:hypothetical protein